MTRVFKTVGVNPAQEIGGDFVDVFPLFEFGIRSRVSGGVSSGGGAGTGVSSGGGVSGAGTGGNGVVGG